MSGGSEMLRSRFSPRAAVLALVSVGVVACSADTTRFNDNPFASHSNPELTASMPQAQTAQAPQPRSATSVAVNSGATSEVTGSVLRKPTSSGNWSWDGGTAITVAAGETIDTIARRSGVPASVIMQANNITAPATLYPGQRLVIPRYKPSRVAAPIL
jgi:LysM repeat protein